jgi:hypothetical protein
MRWRILKTSKVAKVQKVTLNIPLLEGEEAEELLKGVAKEVALLDGSINDVVDDPSQDSTFVTISVPTYDFPYLRSNLKTLLEMKWKMGEFDWDLELHKKKPRKRRKKADSLPEPDITLAYKWWSNYFKKLVAKLLSPEAVVSWMKDEGLEYDMEDRALSGKSRSFRHFNPHPEDAAPLTGTFAEEIFQDFAPRLPELAQELTSSFEQEVLRELPHWALNFRDNIRLSLESKGYSPGEINQVLQEALNQVAVRAALADGNNSYAIVDEQPEYFRWLTDTGIHWDDIYDQRSMEENLRDWEENAVEITHDTLIDELEDHLKQNWWSKYHDKYHPYVRDI